MKGRMNFVANSSSSSVILIIDKEEHERVLEGSHPYVRAVVEHGTWEEEIFGRRFVFHHDLSDRDGYSAIWETDVEYNGEIPDLKYGKMDKYDAWSLYTSKLDKGKVFRSEMEV